MVPPSRNSLTIGAILACAAGCGSGSSALVSDEQLLEFERAALTRQLDEAPSSLDQLLEHGDVVVSIREELLRELIGASLPLRQQVSDRFLLTAHDVEVDFRPGMALVRFAGRVSPVSTPSLSADIEILASLELLETRPEAPMLRGSLSLLGFRTIELGGGKLAPPVERLVSDLARRGLERFGDLFGEIQIPIRLEQEIRIPAVETADVTIPEASLPLRSEVRGAWVGEDRLWVALGLTLAPAELAGGDR